MRSVPPLNLLLQGELVALAVQLAFRGHLGPLEVIWGRAGPPRSFRGGSRSFWGTWGVVWGPLEVIWGRAGHPSIVPK